MGGTNLWNKGIGYIEKKIGALETQMPMRERLTAEGIVAAVFSALRPAWMTSGPVLSAFGDFIIPR